MTRLSKQVEDPAFAFSENRMADTPATCGEAGRRGEMLFGCGTVIAYDLISLRYGVNAFA